MTEPEATVFISYQHADKPLARALADGLDAQGFRIWIDEGELKTGDSLYDSIADALDQVDFVLALMSPTSVTSPWCQKEISLAMTGEVQHKNVTVMPLKIGDIEVPATLKAKKYLEVDPADVPAAIRDIAKDIRGHLAPPRPLPPRRRPRAARPSPPRPSAPHGPLTLVEIDRDGITAPLNDGSRGSALYSVPIRLSGRPDPTWSSLFVQNWDRPPSFTLMHRPGIARVSGDRIVLDGTTVEEVASVHQSTLRAAVEATNIQHAEHTQRQRAAQDAEDDAARRHREEIERGISLIDFGGAKQEPDLRMRILREVQRVEEDPAFAGVLMLDRLAETVGQPKHRVKAELIRLLDDGLIRTPAEPAQDLAGGYDLVSPTLTSRGVQALREP